MIKIKTKDAIVSFTDYDEAVKFYKEFIEKTSGCVDVAQSWNPKDVHTSFTVKGN